MKAEKLDNYMVNIYRTKHYIVEQALKYHYLPDGSLIIFSIDTYYLRNKKIKNTKNYIISKTTLMEKEYTLVLI